MPPTSPPSSGLLPGPHAFGLSDAVCVALKSTATGVCALSCATDAPAAVLFERISQVSYAVFLYFVYSLRKLGRAGNRAKRVSKQFAEPGTRMGPQLLRRLAIHLLHGVVENKFTRGKYEASWLQVVGLELVGNSGRHRFHRLFADVVRPGESDSLVEKNTPSTSGAEPTSRVASKPCLTYTEDALKSVGPGQRDPSLKFVMLGRVKRQGCRHLVPLRPHIDRRCRMSLRRTRSAS